MAHKAQGCAKRQPELVVFLLTFTIHQAKPTALSLWVLLVHRKYIETLTLPQ
ncbi:MAG: hypothetical protein IJX88_02955 [Clostridia bacterium]|nr:hypothetical protein [Clostridia bacterium]